MTFLRAMLEMAGWLWCRATLLCLDRLDDFAAYAWYESRAAIHRRAIERLTEAMR